MAGPETATIPERPPPRAGGHAGPLRFSHRKFREAWDAREGDSTLVARMMLETKVRSPGTLRNWASGKTVPDANQAMGLARVFGKPPLFFFE